MPCDYTPQSNEQSESEREDEVNEALERLKRALTLGDVSVKVGPQGGIAFAGWRDRAGISDLCAYRKLATAGSWELRQAIARAEAVAGRGVDEQAIAAGVHSHDDGKSWGRD